MTGTEAARFIAIFVLCALGGIFLASLITGCSSEIEGWRIEQLKDKCENHGGLARIDMLLKPTGECQDGTWVSPKRPG